MNRLAEPLTTVVASRSMSMISDIYSWVLYLEGLERTGMGVALTGEYAARKVREELGTTSAAGILELPQLNASALYAPASSSGLPAIDLVSMEGGRGWDGTERFDSAVLVDFIWSVVLDPRDEYGAARRVADVLSLVKPGGLVYSCDQFDGWLERGLDSARRKSGKSARSFGENYRDVLEAAGCDAAAWEYRQVPFSEVVSMLYGREVPPRGEEEAPYLVFARTRKRMVQYLIEKAGPAELAKFGGQ